MLRIMLMKEDPKAHMDAEDAREARQGMIMQNLGTHLFTTEPELAAAVTGEEAMRGEVKGRGVDLPV